MATPPLRRWGLTPFLPFLLRGTNSHYGGPKWRTPSRNKENQHPMPSPLRLIGGVLLWTLVAGAAAAEPPRVASPDFEAPSLTEERQTLLLSALRGQVVLLNFWASWCYPCRYEMPHFQTLYDRFHEDGLEVVAIAAYDKLDDARAFQDRYGFTFTLLFDGDKAAVEAFDVKTVPQTFLIGRDGFLIPIPDPRTGESQFIVNDPTIWELPETAEFLEKMLSSQQDGNKSASGNVSNVKVTYTVRIP